MLSIFKRDVTTPTTTVSNINSLARNGNNLFSDYLILLDEKLCGNLFCSDEIVIEQNGVLSGNITSKRCIISGTITGDILSTDQMDIKSTAVIKGNIKSASIHIEPGAVINGSITISEDYGAMADFSEKIREYLDSEQLEAKLANELLAFNAHTYTSAAKHETTPGNKMHWDFKLNDTPDKFIIDERVNEQVNIEWDFEHQTLLTEVNEAKPIEHPEENILSIPEALVIIEKEVVLNDAPKEDQPKSAVTKKEAEEDIQRWW